MTLSEAALECHVDVEVEARPTTGTQCRWRLIAHVGRMGQHSQMTLIQLHHAILLSSCFAVSIDLPNKTNSEALVEVALAR
jgi:hypothetical protein